MRRWIPKAGFFVAAAALVALLWWWVASPPKVVDLAVERVGAVREKLERAEAESGKDSQEVANILDELVTALYAAGQAALPETRAYADRAVKIRQAQSPPDREGLAASLTCLAAVLSEQDEVDEAIRCQRQALELRQKLYPGQPEVAVAHLNLAWLWARAAKFAEARKHYAESFPILEKYPDYQQGQRLAMAWNNYARLLHDTGDTLEAQQYFEKAKDFWERDRETNLRHLAMLYNNLGRLFHDQDDFGTAKEYFEKALEIWNGVASPDRRRLANVLNNLGYLYHQAGERQRAKHFYDRALALRREILDENHQSIAWTVGNLGLLYFEEGQSEKALPLFEEALRIRRTLFGAQHRYVGHSLSYLATLQLCRKRPNEALRLALEAEEIRRQGLYIQDVSERRALGELSLEVFGLEASSLDIGLSAIASHTFHSASLQRVWDSVIRERGLVLDEIVARRRSLHVQGPGVTPLLSKLADARQRLANLWVRGSSGMTSQRYQELVDEARREKEAAEETLARASQRFRAQTDRTKLGWEEVKSAIGKHTSPSALLAYVRYQRLIPKGDGKPRPTPSYMAFLYTSERERVKVFDLGNAWEIDDRIVEWRRAILLGGAVDGAVRRSALAQCRQAGAELRKKLWDPLRADLQQVGRLYVVPDGHLHLVSFAALPGEGDEYLLESAPIVHYLTSEKDLCMKFASGGQGLLAIGRPAFDFHPRNVPGGPTEEAQPTTDCFDLRSARFDDLPMTEAEVAAIEDIFTQNGTRRRNREEGPVDTALGKEASESYFKRLASGHRVLHLATHAYYLDKECGDMAGDRANDRGGRRQLSPSPLLLSGLALAGANQRQGLNPEEDGILSAEEIVSLDLSGVEWAVLSACKTGVGEILEGEGVFGLRRAFQSAGVHTLIASLWPVGDEATKEWMTALYHARFEEGLDTAESVRKASLVVLNQQRRRGEPTHPFFWAAFVAAGDWR